MSLKDIPSPINLKDMTDAQEWERTAMDRPYRLEFFDQFLLELQKLNKESFHILELGSGPGFLAKHLLEAMPDLKMDLLDFSPAMHELARARLGDYLKRVKFIECNFKESNWNVGLGKFDAVVTNQAIHELRHKNYARILHEQVKEVLAFNGFYLVCDHFYEEATLKSNDLFMSLSENRESLESAGYIVKELLVKGGRVLNRAHLVGSS